MPIILTYWMKSHAYEEDWNQLHHISTSHDPDSTLCGINLREKPGVYTLEVDTLEGVAVCQRCLKSRSLSEDERHCPVCDKPTVHEPASEEMRKLDPDLLTCTVCGGTVKV